MNKLASGLLFLLIPFSVSAQVNDAGLWTSLSVQKKIADKLYLDADAELRLNENFSELGTAYTEALISYRISKAFEASAGYRFIAKRLVDDSYGIRHRYLINLAYKTKISKVMSTIRVRYQSQYSDVNRSDDWQVPEDYLRTKWTIKYDTDKDWRPFVSAETFFLLDKMDGMLFKEYRIAAGFDYKLNKKTDLTLGYLIDREVQTSNPWTNYVVTVGLSLKL
ncbi:MAG: DUF2490 domain-containing protein [Bacteroidota bacterium]